MGVILRSKATKNLMVTGSAEILRGVYPEYTEGLRMTWRSFRIENNQTQVKDSTQILQSAIYNLSSVSCRLSFFRLSNTDNL